MKILHITALFLSSLTFSLHAHAKESIDFPPAVPVVTVESEPLSSPSPLSPGTTTQDSNLEAILAKIDTQSNTIVTLELFSSQACVFCPKADLEMQNLVLSKNLIALSCHVDYFDVKINSLSQAICGSRQSEYEASLRYGPKYTPQMVINGAYNAIGYKKEDIIKALQKALENPIPSLNIQKNPNKNIFTLLLPETKDVKAKLWILNYDKPHILTISEGGNKGREMIYYNIISGAGLLGSWDGTEKKMTFDPKLMDGHKGFALFVQDDASKKILMAYKYEK